MSPYNENVELFLKLLNGCDDNSKEIIQNLLLDMYEIYESALDRKRANALLEDRYLKAIMNDRL